jgi:hypothetical protein
MSRHNKILLVTFGSMGNPEPQQKTRIITNVLERNGIPKPAAIECQLEATARRDDSQLGQPYDPTFFGAGLIDAAAAVAARAPGC